LPINVDVGHLRTYLHLEIEAAACHHHGIKPIDRAASRSAKSTSSSYPILVPFPIFRENFMKNIKKPPTADALYLDDGVGNK
jgi:hypothetical protein